MQKVPALSSAAEPVDGGRPNKPKRGRPKSSPHDPAEMNRLRVQRHRDAKKEGEEVRSEIYLPKAWHDWITAGQGINLREAAVEAFALWLERKGYPVGAAGDGSPPLQPS